MPAFAVDVANANQISVKLPAIKSLLPGSVVQLIYNARRFVSPVAILDRRLIAYRFLRGEGIKIGALHLPLQVPRSAKVKYVDHLTVAQLREEDPELSNLPLVEPDIIDDGNRLDTVADRSQDFVIANHLIEHAPDPLGAIGNMLRVLKKDGRLFLAVPDKRYSFDVDRPVTPLEHIIKDHEEGPGAEKQALELMQRDFSIHFHVWSSVEMLEMITFLKKGMQLNFDVEMFYQHFGECIFILKKLA